ncbi:hypothetical protein BD309DRAFT_1024137 [Dichomitus squalens]|nr:hypothetical protein BD309DRAFT_1024137 [Dichomitus squalens]
MRLLDTRTGQFVEKDPTNEDTVFAILSHTWDPTGEQSFKQLRKIQKQYATTAQPPPHNPPGPQPPPWPVPQRPPAVHPSGTPQSPHAPHEPTPPPAVPPAMPLPGERTPLLARTDRMSQMERGLAGDDDGTAPITRTSGSLHLFRRMRQLLTLALVLVPRLLTWTTGPQLRPSAPSPTPTELPVATSPPEHPIEPVALPPSPPLREEDLPVPPKSIWDNPELSPKIREACRVAREAGYDYLWIDSCCINKTSSSELSESINSMYQWYGRSVECYAYLADVPPGEDPCSPKSKFRSSRWFERGWTLQELVSPSEVKFLLNDWNIIGTKHVLVDPVSEITGIPDEALLHEKSLDEFSVAQRLSWAAKRETTRVEDRAYSLLGGDSAAST